MTNPYLGEIRMFTFNFAPKGWAFCNGQLMAISQNQALFALLGTYYGGNGQSTFQLPNMQGAVPIHQGQGSGLSLYTVGQAGGSQSVTLLMSQVPPHSHTFNVTTASATSATIGNTVVPAAPALTNASAYAVAQAADPSLVPQTLAPGVMSSVGGSQPHSNLMPYLCINFCIALQGIFPSQN